VRIESARRYVRQRAVWSLLVDKRREKVDLFAPEDIPNTFVEDFALELHDRDGAGNEVVAAELRRRIASILSPEFRLHVKGASRK
jgi:hypothetical protein